MPTPPAPAADQNATPVYGIRYPKTSSKANMLARDFEDIAEDFETVLAASGVPPVLSGTPVVAASAAARDAHWGTPSTATTRLALQNSGAVTIRTDLGTTERYFAGLTDGGTNAGGVVTPGWYPFANSLDASMTLVRTTNIAIASGVDTVVAYDATDIANAIAGALTPTRATGLLVCARPGQWQFDADLTFTGNTTGSRVVFLEKAVAASPTTFVAQQLFQTSAPISTISASSLGKFILPLLAGDVVRIKGYQNSGAALNIIGAHLHAKQLA